MTHPSLSELRRAYDRVAAHHHGLRAAGILDDEAHVSDFWRDILSDERRRSYPTFDEILVLRRGFTFPLADRGRAADRDAEREYFDAAVDVVRASMPATAIAAIEESALGAPVAFEVEGRWLSSGALVNGLTAHRVVEACRRWLPERPLRILEIGAGYGAVADQLLRRLDVECYAVCDLAPNLFLSGFYLPANHPERPVAFLGEGDDTVPPGGLAFLVPQHLDLARGPWDLVLNSYSFQEMDRASVDAYFAHARATLRQEGLLYSLNAHGKAGIERPSQYPTRDFDVLGLKPVRRYPWSVFGTVPYELVLRPGGGSDERVRLDALGGAMQLGLHDELEGADAAWQRAAADLLWDRNAHDRALDALSATGSAPQATRYLAAMVAFARGHGREALRGLPAEMPQTHARVRAGLMLAAAETEQGDGAAAKAALSDAIGVEPHLAEELRRLAAAPHEARLWVSDQVGIHYDPPAGWRLRWRGLRGRA